MLKKTYSLIISLLIISISIFSTGAAITPYCAGDVDCDKNITIKDATLIQKYLADLENFSYLQQRTSEVDGDDKITIKDATMIQKYVADLIYFFNVPSEIWTDVHIKGFSADYDCGKAMVGVPVKFTAQAKGDGKPYSYQFYVDNEPVTKLTTDNSFTYTFESAGYYTIMVNAVNLFNFSSSTTIYNYEVVEPYTSETLMIKSFVHNNNAGSLHKGSDKTTFTAEAMFGSGCYEYAFYWNNDCVQDFGADNTFTIEKFKDKGTFLLTVKARDLETNEYAEETMEITIGSAII